MNSKLYLIVLGMFISANVYAQRSQDITYSKAFGGYKFDHYGKTLTPKNMLQLMQHDQEAYDYMKKAKANYDAGQVVGFIGGGLIGWQLGAAVAGGDPNWAMAGVGAGILLIAIPLNSGYNNNAMKAVEIFNSANSNEMVGSKLKLQFGLTHHGVGLALKL